MGVTSFAGPHISTIEIQWDARPWTCSSAATCGYVRGIAHAMSPSAGFRFVCYCTDSQALAQILGRPDVLDAAGGTDIFQMAAGRVTLIRGADAMRCITFSGKVLRWYADCCRTPVANTAASPRFPVVAVIHSFMNSDADGASLDEILRRPLQTALTCDSFILLRCCVKRAPSIVPQMWYNRGKEARHGQEQDDSCPCRAGTEG